MATSFRVHYFHLVWSTKERRNLIVPKIKERLYPYMGGIIRKSGGTLLDIGGIPNHVHLLIELSNLDKFTALIRNTKASSTGWIKQEFPDDFFAWQDGYGSFTVSKSQIDNVKHYIQNQEIHHKTQSFETEFINFLKVHQIDYDEKFVGPQWRHSLRAKLLYTRVVNRA